jgi:hypothetical protein
VSIATMSCSVFSDLWTVDSDDLAGASAGVRRGVVAVEERQLGWTETIDGDIQVCDRRFPHFAKWHILCSSLACTAHPVREAGPKTTRFQATPHSCPTNYVKRTQ